jgi:hypothetical protein
MSSRILLGILACRNLKVVCYGYPALTYRSPSCPHVSIGGAELCCSNTATSRRSWAACGRSICETGSRDIVVSILPRKSIGGTRTHCKRPICIGAYFGLYCPSLSSSSAFASPLDIFGILHNQRKRSAHSNARRDSPCIGSASRSKPRESCYCP